MIGKVYINDKYIGNNIITNNGSNLLAQGLFDKNSQYRLTHFALGNKGTIYVDNVEQIVLPHKYDTTLNGPIYINNNCLTDYVSNISNCIKKLTSITKTDNKYECLLELDVNEPKYSISINEAGLYCTNINTTIDNIEKSILFSKISFLSKEKYITNKFKLIWALEF